MKKSICRRLSLLLAAFFLFAAATTGYAAENRFSDVTPSSYYYDAVLWAVENGITVGTSETTFSPKDTCTRAQVVTFLWRAAGAPEPELSENPFQDVSSGKYYFNAVLWAAENGITSGTSANQFSPNVGCSRAQVVTFLWRFAGSPEPSASDSPFEDVKPDKYYTKAVLWAVETCVTAGTSSTSFSPDDICTRAQIVTFLWRWAKYRPATLTEEHFQDGDSEIGYLLYTPANPQANMPLIVYLHGGSGKGSDLSLLTENDGFPQYLQDGRLGAVPAYVIVPQLGSDYKGWTDVGELLIALIGDTIERNAIDESRISLTGHSMGGTGTWGVAAAYPGTFSRIMPLSGSIRTTEANLGALSEMPIWTFVGDADTIVSPNSTRQFVAQLRLRNPDITLTELAGATHFDVPALVYLSEEYDVISWLTE